MFARGENCGGASYKENLFLFFVKMMKERERERWRKKRKKSAEKINKIEMKSEKSFSYYSHQKVASLSPAHCPAPNVKPYKRD